MARLLLKVVRICNSLFKCNFLRNKKLFLNFFFDSRILHQILNILKEKMIVIANVFPKLQTVKNLIRPISKKRRFRTRFDSQHFKASEIFVKSPWEHFYHVFASFSGKLIWKISPLVLGEILGVFVNTLTAKGMYPVQDSENFPLPIQMQLSEKWKRFSQFLFHFLNLQNTLNILKGKIIVIANVFPNLEIEKKILRTLSK